TTSERLPFSAETEITSVRTFPSTLIKRCLTIFLASSPVKAYFKRLRKNRIRGKHSRSLCGPVLGLGAKAPANLSNIQWRGAFKRFKCFLGPRAIIFYSKRRVNA
uniref:Uncharacterized protein n=1 Tax=Romanomermis culicivorax TaxID=13658 RepID=A0A915JWT9_ROMCU